jgi:hypothetical protein
MIRLSEISDNIDSARAFIAVGGIYEMAAQVAASQKEELLSLNRDQLLSGRSTEGSLLTPDYLSDTYFKSREKAEAYASFKDALFDDHKALIRHRGLYPEKPYNIPNLIITGAFQNGMYLLVSGRSYELDSGFYKSGKIQAKYNHTVFGFAPPSVLYFFREYIAPEVKRVLKI